ncbi:MAG: four helix bundle protein [Elusimicrobiota bacterium]
MENDKAKFKKEFKERIYQYILKLIKFIDNLPKDRTCDVIGKQLLRSGTSIGANYIEAQASSSRKDFTNFLASSILTLKGRK